MRGGKFIFVNNFSAQEHAMAVRDIKLLNVFIKKIYTYLGIFSLFRSLSIRKSAYFIRGLQSWTKVLGQIYICGAFSNAPNKESRANSSTLRQPLPPSLHPPPTPPTMFSPEFQHCMEGEGETNLRSSNS